jgi:uncharacterized membrane protein (UPF0127 family)
MRRAPLLLVALLASACAGDQPPAPDPGASVVSGEVIFRTDGGERSLSVRVADSEAERAQGLMGVRDLPDDEGMAFVFDEPSTTAFWMKGTAIPLSIAFVGTDGHILNIAEMTPCRTDPCPTYAPDGPTGVAVEANAGWFERNGIGAGDEALLLEGS